MGGYISQCIVEDNLFTFHKEYFEVEAIEMLFILLNQILTVTI